MDRIVKICGLSTEETVDAALEAGADMVGFVCFAKSPRHVSLERAASLAARARGRAETVLLTVDLDPGALAAAVELFRPDWLQMHGGETPETVFAAKSLGIPVIKALPVESRADLAKAALYVSSAARLLLDAKPPRGADRPGGHGIAFDWTLLDGFRAPLPYLLSGGLTVDNVGEALRLSGAPGVDVSSGVETAPGVKSAELIAAFVAAARRAHAPADFRKIAS